LQPDKSKGTGFGHGHQQSRLCCAFEIIRGCAGGYPGNGMTNSQKSDWENDLVSRIDK
jgi:hypothetical protein